LFGRRARQTLKMALSADASANAAVKVYAMNDAAKPQATADVQEIYRLLKRGLGHDLVNDVNVFELIQMAARDDQKLLEQELREWQAPCDPNSSGLPSTIAPTRGFNRENVKHR
jgi:hypothetical protein